MRKTIGIVVFLIAVLILLTGCSINIDYKVKVNPNGTGEISYIYGYSKDTLESLQKSSDELVEDKKVMAENNGYKTEKYVDDEMEGFKATKFIKDLSTEFSLAEAFGKENVEDKEGQGITIEKGATETVIKQDTKIDLTALEDVSSALNIKYTVELPVKADSSNAQTVSNNGKTLSWNLTPGEVNKIEFVATKVNTITIIGEALLTVIIIGGIVCFGKYYEKKKKETNK